MSYTYNGKGEQVRRTAGATSTHTVYDEAGHWLGDYNGYTAIQNAIWLDDLPIGLIANNQLHYLEPDHLGTPRAVIEPVRDVAVWKWDLKGEAFGNTVPNQDPDGDGTSFVLNMRFPGQRYDAASGLNYNYFRDYEPGTGRYIESDPIGLDGGVSTYAYVGGNPLLDVDPTGQLPLAAPVVVGAAAVRICMRIPRCRVQLAKLTKEAKDLCDDVRCNLKRDSKPHYFPGVGHCQHWQINCYIQGKAGSGFSFRVPIPGACSDTREWIPDPERRLP
ncbi:MAG: RHS repeat-associated core domain-containing protein, partial [Telluria sp.]